MVAIEEQLNFTALKNLLHRIEDKLEAIQDLEALRVKEYFTHSEAQQYLGVSKQKIWELRKKGEIPFYRNSKRTIYYKKSDLDNWITQNMVAADSDVLEP